jgi:hypothetical protein
MLVQSLGLVRLRTHTETLDARLRIKQALPTNPSRDDLQFLGARESEEFATVSGPHDLYTQLLKSNGTVPEFLSYQLHKAASPQSDSFWNEVLAQEISAVEDDMYTAGVYDEEEEIEEGGMTFDEMVQTLTLGLEDEPVTTSPVLQID